jgi:hypothetical protein
LRNQRNRTVKDDVDNTLTKTVREHVDSAPSNTFTTVLTHNTASLHSERADQIRRMRESAEGLKNSLRAFISTEKKTLK